MAKRKAKLEQDQVAVPRAPCAHADKDGFCVDPEAQGQGAKCSWCYNYRPSTAIKVPCVHADEDGVCTMMKSNTRGATCDILPGHYHECFYYGALPSDEPPAQQKGAASVLPLMVGKEIAVDDIHESPYQTRRDHGDLEGLAASIRQHGMLNPVTARPLKKGGVYELIAGHRRLKAARLAGLAAVPATVVECDDRTAAEMCVAENMQRQDLTPLEEAAGVAALIGTGHTPQDVADRLGKSRQWVARRAKLLDLAEELKAAYADPDCSFSLAPVAGLELIAALPLSVQQELGVRWWHSQIAPTLDDIRKQTTGLMQDLKRAPFDTGECETCHARTGCQPDLFDGGETCDLGRCLAPECWNAKRAAALEEKIRKLKASKPDVPIFSTDYALRHRPDIVDGFCVSPCKKGDKHAVPAVELMPDGRTRATWIVDREAQFAAIGGQRPEPGPKQPSAEEKRMAKVIKHVRCMLEETTGNLSPHPFEAMEADKILCCTSVAGTQYAPTQPHAVTWDLTGWEPSAARRELWSVVCPVLLKRICPPTITGCEPYYQEAVAQARVLFGMGEEDLRNEVGV